MIHKTFVGRGDELGQIREWLNGPSGRLALITGPGGIGKTSILGKIEKEYSATENFVVEYFDLAEQPMTALNQALHLADTLGRENFPQFTQKLTVLDAGLDSSSTLGLEEDVLNTFTAEVADYLKIRRKKLLRITDTFEIVLKYSRYGDNWAKGINETLKNIPGTFFLIAGRDKVKDRDSLEDKDVLGEILPMFKESFGSENILRLPLRGFDDSEMEDFFEECDSHRVIPQDMRKKLQLLTGGRPILLSLAVEWLQKEIPLPALIDQNLNDLHKLFENEDARKDLQDDFEFELVSKIRQLHTPFDIASLYMAHIDRRMDSRLLSVLLDIDEQTAEQHMMELLQFPFVKEYVGTSPKRCALHDEMGELVRKHAWQYLDINGGERKRLTRKVIDNYYLPRIDAFKKQKQDLLQESQTTLLQDVEARKNDLERWLLEAETLSYFIKLSKEDGYKYFDQVFYDREKTPIRDQILIDELKRAGAYDKDKIALRDADDLHRRGRRDAARQLCLEVLEKENLDSADLIHGFNMLGLLDSDAAPLAAETNFQKALKLAQTKNDLRVQGIIYNNLGRLFRNTSQLDSSIDCFNKALDFARRSGTHEMGGAITNNLAWTHRLNGNLDEAEALCSLSIAENRKRSQERPLAYAYLTKADIDRDRGDFHAADRYAKQALDIFVRLEDNEGKIQAYRTLANVFRYLHNYAQAIKYLEDGILLAQKHNAFPLLASLYQLQGRTYRHYAEYLQQQPGNETEDFEMKKKELFQFALEALQTSIDISQKIGSRWEVARSQLEVALITLSEQAYDEAELTALLDQVWKTSNELGDEFLKGYVYENRARIEMKNGRYLEAGRAFGEAAYYIANRTGVETARAFDRLHNTLLDASLSNEQGNALAQGVYQQVLQQEYYEYYPKLTALINMCEHILGLPITGREAQ